MKKIAIYGAGRLGRQVYHLLKNYCVDYEVLGFVDDTKKDGIEIIDGYKTIGSLNKTSKEPRFGPEKIFLAFAIGYKNMMARQDAFGRAKELGYRFINILHPRSMVEPNVKLGEGIIILAGCILDQYVVVGDNNYFDIGVRIGENSEIGENNYFSSGAVMGGYVKVAQGCFLGMDVTVVNDIEIGENSFVNAKTLVYKNVEENSHVIQVHDIKSMLRK